MAIDENIGHGRIGHERCQRADARGLFKQILGKLLPLELVERQLFDSEHTLDEGAHRVGERLLAHPEHGPAI